MIALGWANVGAAVAPDAALASVASIPKIEVHISNVHTREEFRHTSVTVPVCNGQVVGLGLKGYLYAMEAVVDMAECKAKE